MKKLALYIGLFAFTAASALQAGDSCCADKKEAGTCPNAQAAAACCGAKKEAGACPMSKQAKEAGACQKNQAAKVKAFDSSAKGATQLVKK